MTEEGPQIRQFCLSTVRGELVVECQHTLAELEGIFQSSACFCFIVLMKDGSRRPILIFANGLLSIEEVKK